MLYRIAYSMTSIQHYAYNGDDLLEQREWLLNMVRVISTHF